MTSRLSSIAADLAERLQAQDIAHLRQVSARAVHLAVVGTGIAAPELDVALAALNEGRFGDSAGRAAIVRLAEELDNVAWDIQEQRGADAVSLDTYSVAFARARAAAAVGFSLDSDALVAALEAVYESQAALDDLDAIRAAVESALAE